MDQNVIMKEHKWTEVNICNFNAFVSLFKFSLAGPMCFTLKSEELNGVTKFILKRRKKKKIDLFNHCKFYKLTFFN